MATTDHSIDGRREWCHGCGRDTLHRVSIQMRTEGSGGDAAKFSRKPYRVAECQRCGAQNSERMDGG